MDGRPLLGRRCVVAHEAGRGRPLCRVCGASGSVNPSLRSGSACGLDSSGVPLHHPPISRFLISRSIGVSAHCASSANPHGHGTRRRTTHALTPKCWERADQKRAVHPLPFATLNPSGVSSLRTAGRLTPTVDHLELEESQPFVQTVHSPKRNRACQPSHAHPAHRDDLSTNSDATHRRTNEPADHSSHTPSQQTQQNLAFSTGPRRQPGNDPITHQRQSSVKCERSEAVANT